MLLFGVKYFFENMTDVILFSVLLSVGAPKGTRPRARPSSGGRTPKKWKRRRKSVGRKRKKRSDSEEEQIRIGKEQVSLILIYLEKNKSFESSIYLKNNFQIF